MSQRRTVRPRPLGRGDPPSLGEVRLLGRLATTDSGTVYAGRLAGVEGETDVAVAMLGSGAESDSFARARFIDAVAELRASANGAVLAWEDDAEFAPWVAVGNNGGDGGGGGEGDEGDGLPVERSMSLLAAVTLADHEPAQPLRGPGFRPHWFRRRGPGRWRLWPLPWPVSLTAAGRWTFAAAFALVLAIAALALFIAVQIFHDHNPAPVRPPFPQPSPTQPSTPTPSSPQSPSPSTPTPSNPPQPGPTGPTSPGGSPLPPID